VRAFLAWHLDAIELDRWRPVGRASQTHRREYESDPSNRIDVRRDVELGTRLYGVGCEPTLRYVEASGGALEAGRIALRLAG